MTRSGHHLPAVSVVGGKKGDQQTSPNPWRESGVGTGRADTPRGGWLCLLLGYVDPFLPETPATQAFGLAETVNHISPPTSGD